MSVISRLFCPLQDELLGMSSLSKGIADIFDESENDQTFYGFSDSEICDLCDLKVSRHCCIYSVCYCCTAISISHIRSVFIEFPLKQFNGMCLDLMAQS